MSNGYFDLASMIIKNCPEEAAKVANTLAEMLETGTFTNAEESAAMEFINLQDTYQEAQKSKQPVRILYSGWF